MKVDRFRSVECRDAHRRWVLADRIHCNVVETAEGFHWGAWIEDEDGRMGPMDSGRAPDADAAESLAKQSAVLLYTESLSSSERASCRLALVTKGQTKRVSLRRAGGTR